MSTLIELTSSLPFTSDFDFFFEKDTLVFTIFVINPVISDDEKFKKLSGIYQDLNEFLLPWSKYYTWGFEKYQIELASYQENNEKYDYIFGSLQFSSCISDEWLLVSLVLKYFKGYEKVETNLDDVMIHFFDQDGEFILIESFEHIPDWCSPDNSFNRAWFNGKGDLVLIPGKYPVSNNIENLKLQQALLFLNKYNYYVDKVSLHDAGNYIWKSKLDNAIEESLKMSMTTTVQVNESLCFWLFNLTSFDAFTNQNFDAHSKNIIARSFESFVNENNGEFDQSNELMNNLSNKYETQNQKLLNDLIFKGSGSDDLIKLQIRLPFLWFYISKTKFDHIATYSEANQTNRIESLEKYLGKVLVTGLSNIMKSDIEVENQFLRIIEKLFDGGLNKLSKLSLYSDSLSFMNIRKEQIREYNSEQLRINEIFQKELIDKFHLINEIVPSHNFDEFAKDTAEELSNVAEEKKTNNPYADIQKPEENEIIERIKKFIEEENTSFGKDVKGGENDFSINIEEEINEYYKNDSDDESDSDKSQDVVGSLKKSKNNVKPESINEDDFFEFFLTKALKIPREELVKYAAKSTNVQIPDCSRSDTRPAVSKMKETKSSDENQKVINGEDIVDVDDNNEDYVDYADYVDDDIPEEEMNNIILKMKEISTHMGFKPNSNSRNAFIETIYEDN